MSDDIKRPGTTYFYAGGIHGFRNEFLTPDELNEKDTNWWNKTWRVSRVVLIAKTELSGIPSNIDVVGGVITDDHVKAFAESVWPILKKDASLPTSLFSEHHNHVWALQVCRAFKKAGGKVARIDGDYCTLLPATFQNDPTWLENL